MRVEQLGEGEPEVAVVGGIHGDEPSGVRAVERLLADECDVRRPVKLVIANERALDAGVRYIDADLNRAFTETVPQDAHERTLAKQLASEVEGCTVLSIHSTQSHADPFAISAGLDNPIPEIIPHLPVTALIDTNNFGEGRLFAAEADIIEVEAGLQGSETAAENAYRLARAFLTTVGAIPGDVPARELPVFRMDEPIQKPPGDAYEVFVDNFERVGSGETFAAVDGEKLIAKEAFWPLLLSPYGYVDQFGYRGERMGTLSAQSSEGPNSTSVKSRSSAQ